MTKQFKTKLLIILIIILTALIMFGVSRLTSPYDIKVSLSENAPLGALAVINSREPVQISLLIKGKHEDDLAVDFKDFAIKQEIPILGLYPDTANKVEITLTTHSGKQYEKTITLQTKPLPSDFPHIETTRFFPDLIASGMTFLHLGRYDANGSYSALPCALDSFGEVRWFYTGEIGHVLKQTNEGTLIIQEGDSLVEIDMLGNVIKKRTTLLYGIHHDMAETDKQSFLILSSSEDSFEDGVVEVDSSSGAFLRAWDFRTILDQTRPSQPKNLESEDWLHLNGIAYDHTDDSFIVSGRDQSAVVKVNRDAGKLVWILGNHEHWPSSLTPYLLEPTGKDFEWQWGQHAPMIDPNNPDRILIYDDGNERSYENPVLPRDNYSRAVEYEIDEKTMTVRQIWQYGKELGSETFTPFIGDANYLENGNRLVCFGGITRNLQHEPIELFDFENNTVNRMKISSRIVEVTDDIPAKEVLRFSISDPDDSTYAGYSCYQAERYPLYVRQ